MAGQGRAGATEVVRPVGSPLPLGFLALAVSTAAFSAVQLGWVPPGAAVGFVALMFTAPVQLVVAVVALLARDPVVGRGRPSVRPRWSPPPDRRAPISGW